LTVLTPGERKRTKQVAKSCPVGINSGNSLAATILPLGIKGLTDRAMHRTPQNRRGCTI